jgi:hypothetical protein
MKSVFETYQSLWPVENHGALRPLLEKVPVIHYPDDRALFKNVLPNYVVVVVKKAALSEIVGIAEQGFEHIVQADREDFPQELLASALMTVRPEKFMKSPLPFFFTGFRSAAAEDSPEQNFVVNFNQSGEKRMALNWLENFLNKFPRASSVKDLCMQSADELFTNAIYNAPIRPSGARPFKDVPRDQEVVLPGDKKGSLFACYSDKRVILGVTDPFGSLEKNSLMLHLRTVLKEGGVPTRQGIGGAGLGFKYLIENSANFYVIASRGVSTLVACGFSLKGLKSNMTMSKHFHMSFR